MIYDLGPLLIDGAADYEKGTWTPVLELGGGTTGITYSRQVGSYVKIGHLVSVTVRIILTSKGTDTGNLTVSGLPFEFTDDVNAYQATTPIFMAVTTDVTHPMFTGAQGNSYVAGYDMNSYGYWSTLDNTNIANGSYLYFTFNYITTE